MSARVAGRLLEAGWSLPEPPRALGMYVPATRVGGLVFTSGQLPLQNGSLMSSGRVGEAVSAETARLCAERCALNALAAAASVCDLDAVVRVVRLTGYVASHPSFRSQPAVIDGASAVMASAFGDAGAHARVAVGVASLPMGSPVEIEVILALA